LLHFQGLNCPHTLLIVQLQFQGFFFILCQAGGRWGGGGTQRSHAQMSAAADYGCFTKGLAMCSLE
jgi:hypothetical protein